MDIPAELRTPDGQTITAMVTDISRTGLGISCNRETAFCLLPEDQRTPGQVIDVELDIQLLLPFATEPARPIEAHCRLVHTRRLAQDDYQIGMQFIDLSNEIDSDLVRFVAECIGF